MLVQGKELTGVELDSGDPGAGRLAVSARHAPASAGVPVPTDARRMSFYTYGKSPLQQLLAAKAESDRRNYAAKHHILRELLSKLPDQFLIDSQQRGIVGLTHPSSGFKIHAPRAVVPSGIKAAEHTHTSDDPFGVSRTISIDELLKHLGKRQTQSVPIERLIGDLNRSSNTGFSKKRYEAADVSYPLIINKRDRLIDGRHRLAKLVDSGATSASVYRLPESALLKAVIPPIKSADWKVVSASARSYAKQYATSVLHPHTKSANVKVEDILGPVAQAGGWKEGPVASVFGGPNTLSAAIGSGLIGAGVGYGSGWLAEKSLPVRQGRLRKTLAALGALVGTAPALALGHHGFFKANSAEDEEKLADFDTSSFAPIIPKDSFNRVVWSDPNTPMPLRAATSGLVDGASDLRGGASYVSPADVARLAVGMGAGYASGLVVGKALGALAGLTDDAQKSLIRAGTWAGFLGQVVPLAFSR